jgi:hypothetical protein
VFTELLTDLKMTGQDIVDLAKIRLQNTAISRNEDVLIKFIYLGISELYRRFNLAIRSETIMTNTNRSMYELKNSDVSLILGVYDREGRELQQSDVVNSMRWEYKLINYRSFILNKPLNQLLYVVYKASPTVISDAEDALDLPDAMIDALLCYVSYMGFSTLNSPANNKQGGSEPDIYYQKFIAACNELEMQGYKIPLSSESLAVAVKGFV